MEPEILRKIPKILALTALLTNARLGMSGASASPIGRSRQEVVLFKEFNCLISTTSALRATPPHLRMGIARFIRSANFLARGWTPVLLPFQGALIGDKMTTDFQREAGLHVRPEKETSMATSNKSRVNRRRFLKGAAAGAAA